MSIARSSMQAQTPKSGNRVCFRSGASNLRLQRHAPICRAAETETAPVAVQEPPAVAAPATPAASAAPSDDSWISVMAPEDLPKGVRKEVRIDGRSILMFWYRNQIYAISSRSPAEGAYSEGFIKAKFTQDYGIICPTTDSVFSLKDGAILDWYPSNPVLRSISPPTGKLQVFPVKLTQKAIQVSLAGTRSAPTTRGGADSSLESNNVFADQLDTYLVGSEEDTSSGAAVSTVATFTVAISAFAIVATAGTATALYYEDPVLLVGFWGLMLATGGAAAWQYFQSKEE